jgi:hypothetical protein
VVVLLVAVLVVLELAQEQVAQQLVAVEQPFNIQALVILEMQTQVAVVLVVDKIVLHFKLLTVATAVQV